MNIKTQKKIIKKLTKILAQYSKAALEVSVKVNLKKMYFRLKFNISVLKNYF